jgi:hypothetical protein
VLVSPFAVDQLRRRAEHEGMSGQQLAAVLLETIVRDNLYDAVLDRE